MAVELDEQLLDILACPCPEHGALRPERGAEEQVNQLICAACGTAFPVRDGVPVLLWDEASGPVPDSDDTGAR